MSKSEPASEITGPLTRELDDLQSQVNALMTEVEMLRHRDLALDAHLQRLDEEMRLAARMQQDFLPQKLPQFGPVQFHCLFRPASYVSGDFYDVRRLDENHVAFYMVDAVGHGTPAALLTMFLKQALVTREVSPPGYRLLTPGETLAHLNETLLKQNLSCATFVTAVYGLINTRTLELSLARGGHPEPVLMSAGADVRCLEADGPLVGVFPDTTFQTTVVQLQPGDRVIVYTDGIEFAFGDERGRNRNLWYEELRRRRCMTADGMLADIARHLDSEAGSLWPKDDLTMVIMQV